MSWLLRYSPFRPRSQLLAMAARKPSPKKEATCAALIKLLRPLGHYVEANSKGDPTILAASGFKAANKVHVTPQPMEQAVILNVMNGPSSGQVTVKGKTQPKARSYVLRYALIGADGKAGTWTDIGVTNPRAISVHGLTPGANYAFQIRALGSIYAKTPLIEWTFGIL